MEPLEQTLERTGDRASLAPEYLDGRAPAIQHREAPPDPGSPTYYDLPSIKKPEWKWPVPAYFFVGGLASGAYIVAALVDLQGCEEDRSLVRAGRYLQFGSLLLCPPLLIADLGRPERFHHMLRVFRPRSMMNQGSWGLTLFGLFSTAAAAAQALEDLAPQSRVRRLSNVPLRAFSWLGIVPAAYVGSYTGVLLSATNVPLWAGNKYGMGPLFFSSALAAGLAGTRLTADLLRPVECLSVPQLQGAPSAGADRSARLPVSEATEEGLRRAENVVAGAELALVAASACALGNLARPLKTGPLGLTFQVGALGLGILAPLALRALSTGRLASGRERLRPRSRFVSVLSSTLVLAGSAVLKFAVTEAGKRSADDPRAYFEYTKASTTRKAHSTQRDAGPDG
jgi:formate-dependent nitrite reductase membrane component NrfD